MPAGIHDQVDNAAKERDDNRQKYTEQDAEQDFKAETVAARKLRVVEDARSDIADDQGGNESQNRRNKDAQAAAQRCFPANRSTIAYKKMTERKADQSGKETDNRIWNNRHYRR